MRGTKRLFAVVVAGALALLATRSATAADSRELRAREAFAAQRYQDALDLFAKLYAETLHPIYLRNIGRCYQNLDQPDQAISSFREYLRKAKNPTADETKEIEGFIKEMEERKREKEASANPTPPPKTDSSDAVKPLPSAKEPSGGANANANASLIVKPAEPPPEESHPLYSRWWFWAIVGGVVAAGVGIAFATGVFTKTEDASCPTDRTCGIQ